jgi:hypothetical protein
MTVQIVRLKDGSDVICHTEKNMDMVELDYPMMFSIVNQNLVLQHWLPLSVMKGTSVKIPRDEIVCFMDPNENFEEYYNTAVQKISSVMDNEDEEELQDMMEALDELEHKKGISIH